jgi:hypothetical protein
MAKWKQLISDIYDDYEIIVNIPDPDYDELMRDAPIVQPPTEQELNNMAIAYETHQWPEDDLPF